MTADSESNDQPSANPSSADEATYTEEVLYGAITRIASALGFGIDRSTVDLYEAKLLVHPDREIPASCGGLVEGCKQAGIYLKLIELSDVDEVYDLIGEGFPVVSANQDGSIAVLEKLAGRKIDISIVGGPVAPRAIGKSRLRQMLFGSEPQAVFVAKKELECDSFAAGGHAGKGHGGGGHSGGGHGGGGHGDSAHGAHHHDHPKPLRRFIGMLQLDLRDILTISLFAFVAGGLSLATPLAIESMVNVVSWGTYVQPLLVIAMMLLACLGISGFLKVLQTVLVETIQRRQLVRIVGDLAHRFPRANRESLAGEYPRELANRVFDIMTIQKATAVLLMDGVSIILTTVLGLVLLAFYHPFLLGFDIVLVISMISITWILGRGGVRTAIDESIVKYRIAHWLQDVIASPSAFKINGGEGLAVSRANRLVSLYLEQRRKQFRVVLRQVTFAIGLQVIASTAVLGLGGWLVIQGQLTLGQLVASELVVTVVVGAFAKAGKSLEKFYDLMAGIDKVGHLLDVPVDPRSSIGVSPDGPASVRWDDLEFHFATGTSKISATEISAGSRVAIVGDDVSGKSSLAKSLVGLVAPNHGVAEVAGWDAGDAGRASAGQMIAYAGDVEVFHSTLAENIDLGRSGIGQNRVREVLHLVGLWEDVLRLPDGIQTKLQSNAYPLSRTQSEKLMVARAISSHPKLLVIDGILDHLDADSRDSLFQVLADPNAPWTLVIVTNDDALASKCDQQISVRTN
ncbi:Alpha-hemolysin translocation ATP-binding protein HlyB [Rubripirellula tenax]|uniref:Alpha-hemolysin translocation ATP-binding protein HlyB n=1 Tax=Rubripirellula tenax TaxID=2528015 RepID=A0A5C6EEV1_9BACT|nr:ATP-binding cassette domain-containing protein [Rubripirellula tenax]TWU47358.1 Alpha-hemolysin translocation ATP-binding protein HlyB [Rubripirellula tenax]